MPETPETASTWAWLARQQEKIRKVLRTVLGIDRAIAFTIFARGWASLAGLVTMALIARFLSPAEQGYYYTFSSLVALQLIFELGFSFVILQLAAHERAQLRFAADGLIEGNPVAHSRLASVLQTSVKWYSGAALLMVATLLLAGLRFFRIHAGTGVAWKLPWCLLAVMVALTFQLDPVFSFLEGCGFIWQVASMRFGQAFVGSLLAWAAISTHHGLYAPAMVVVGQATVGICFLGVPQRSRILKGLLRFPVREHFVGWRREIWPFQWKIAASSLSGYFIFQLFNPVLFAYQGPVAAGRMGMSLSISSAIGAIAMSWMNTKASPFGNLIARGEIAVLDKLFFRTLWQSTSLAATGALSFFLFLLWAGHNYPKLASRTLTPWAFAMLLLAMVINQLIFAEALYLRAHKREPFLVISVAGAFLQGCATWALGKYWNANAVATSTFVLTALFGLPTGTYIFITKRRQWHTPAVSPGRAREYN